MFKEVDSKTYALLRAATIPNDIHTDAQYEYLPESCLKNFLEVLADNTTQKQLGWLFLRTCKETYVPRLISSLTEQSSLKAALQKFSTLLKKESSAENVYLEQAGGSWWLVREKSGLDEGWFKYAEMFSVICMAELLRALTHQKWLPQRIGIQHPNIDEFSQLPSLQHAQFFIERPVTAIEIPESLLLSPIQLPKNINKVAQHQSCSIPPSSFKQQFTLAITPYLSMGKLPIKIAAEILRLNVRTLQRRLESENIVYKQLIEALVFEQISKHLSGSNENITQIANRYGYSDAAHFTRSFKRIYGCTPSQYRKSHQ